MTEPHPQLNSKLALLAVDGFADQIVVRRTQKAKTSPGRFIDRTSLTKLLGKKEPKVPSAMRIAKAIVDSAIIHTEDSGEEHWKGDCEQSLRTALALLTPEQRLKFLEEQEIQDVFDNGLRMRGKRIFGK